MSAPTREQWLTERRKGIGGSDISAILGVSRWSTALDVWFDKTGRSPLDAKEDTEPMQWGRILEDVVAREWARRTERTVQRITAVLHHPDQPVFRGSIDRAVVDAGRRAIFNAKTGRLSGAAGVLEVKALSAHAMEQWVDAATGEETVPMQYAAQGLWYLGLSPSLPWVEFAALIGGQKLITRRVQRDDDLIRYMQERALRFWQDHVLTDVMPPPANEADVLRLFPRDTGRSVEADSATMAAVLRLRELKAQASVIEKEADEMKDRIKLAMVDAATLTIDSKPAITWKASKDGVKTDWQLVSDDLRRDHGITPEQYSVALLAHTVTTPGTRRFIIK